EKILGIIEEEEAQIKACERLTEKAETEAMAYRKLKAKHELTIKALRVALTDLTITPTGDKADPA
ncbi:MAG: hypothetical protein GY722_10175, partial [bacterium]|nr:hypothetical protein [bacterium]